MSVIKSLSILLISLSLLIASGVAAYVFAYKPGQIERGKNECVERAQKKYEDAWCNAHRGMDGHCQGLPVAPPWRGDQPFWDEMRKEKEFCLKQYE